MTEIPSQLTSEDDFWGSADDGKEVAALPACAEVFILRDDECASEVFVDDSSSTVCDADVEDISSCSESDYLEVRETSQSGDSMHMLFQLARINTCMLTASLICLVLTSI